MVGLSSVVNCVAAALAGGNMKVIISQTLIGLGAVLATLGIVDEVGLWGLFVGVAVYLVGIAIGQS